MNQDSTNQPWEKPSIDGQHDSPEMYGEAPVAKIDEVNDDFESISHVPSFENADTDMEMGMEGVETNESIFESQEEKEAVDQLINLVNIKGVLETSISHYNEHRINNEGATSPTQEEIEQIQRDARANIENKVPNEVLKRIKAGVMASMLTFGIAQATVATAAHESGGQAQEQAESLSSKEARVKAFLEGKQVNAENQGNVAQHSSHASQSSEYYSGAKHVSQPTSSRTEEVKRIMEEKYKKQNSQGQVTSRSYQSQSIQHQPRVIYNGQGSAPTYVAQERYDATELMKMPQFREGKKHAQSGIEYLGGRYTGAAAEAYDIGYEEGQAYRKAGGVRGVDREKQRFETQRARQVYRAALENDRMKLKSARNHNEKINSAINKSIDGEELTKAEERRLKLKLILGLF